MGTTFQVEKRDIAAIKMKAKGNVGSTGFVIQGLELHFPDFFLLYNYMLDKKEPQWEVEWRNEEELQQSRQWSIQVEINKNN